MLNFVLMHSAFCRGVGSCALHDDENDALLGGQARMTDEERFKVGITVNTFPPRDDQNQNFKKFLSLILLNDENQIAACENTEEVSFE